MTISDMQDLNRATIEYASTVLIPGMTLIRFASCVRNTCFPAVRTPFEPHISMPGSLYGFKKENIYRFRSGVPEEL